MKVIRTVKTLQKRISLRQLQPVGLVPTMGALHMGHISLVKYAVNHCPLVIVSIYVNPTQFNDKADLKNYPRTTDADLALLGDVLRTNDVVFLPGDKEVYPATDKRVFRFGNLDNVMEAVQRPGHFNGVAQVVSRFFDIVKPDIAYFGLKDFQQVAVVRDLVRQTGNKVTVKGLPTVREEDGLAMSSRNRLLEPEHRKNAGVIYKTLAESTQMIRSKDLPEIKAFVKKEIGDIKGFHVEYFEIVDDKELIPVTLKAEMQKDKRYFGCIAVKAGNVRLIDNIEFPV